VLLYRFEVSQDTGVTERRLGPGPVLVGGGLQADLVIPALLDPELCEIILPSVADKPLKVTALVEGLLVNGRELKRGQSVSAPRLELSADGVTLRVESGMHEAETLAAPHPSAQDKFASWIERAKKGQLGGGAERAAAQGDAAARPAGAIPTLDTLGAHPAVVFARSNPAYPLLGLALVLGLLAFLISGWPSAKFKSPQLPNLVGADREGATSLLAEIRKRLVAADLASAVKAELSGGGVRLSGMVDPNQAQRLGELVRNASRPGGIPIRNEVTMANADAATGIESVVTAPSKGVVVSGGRLFREGQTIPSGWLVEQIGHGEVRLKRDTLTHVIAMSGPTPEAPPGAARVAQDDSGARIAPVARTRGLEPISSAPPEPPRPAVTQPLTGPVVHHGRLPGAPHYHQPYEPPQATGK
jgi:hypothetical protein